MFGGFFGVLVIGMVAQVRRAKAKCSSECKSRPGKGRSVPVQPSVIELIFMIRDVEMISKRADDMCRREMGV